MSGLLNWKLKATLQRACARLPVGRQQAYYFVQRGLGSLRRPPDPLALFEEAAGIFKDLRDLHFSLEGKRVLEVGTGRRLDLPIAWFLGGAESVTTIDLHPYLRGELVMDALERLRDRRQELARMLEPYVERDVLDRRLDRLFAARGIRDALRASSIRYCAPADAEATGLSAGSVDLHCSYTVLEHIPQPNVLGILREARRLLSPRGLACHQIDLSDHCAHNDPNISAVNFLQFSDDAWRVFNDNAFAYQNRLRVDDYARLYHDAGHEILLWRQRKDPRSERLLQGGFPLAAPFRGLPSEMLATVNLRVLSRPEPRPRVIY